MNSCAREDGFPCSTAVFDFEMQHKYQFFALFCVISTADLCIRSVKQHIGQRCLERGQYLIDCSCTAVTRGHNNIHALML